MEEAAKEAIAVRKRMARLRELRLAKEVSVRALIAAGNDPNAKTKKAIEVSEAASVARVFHKRSKAWRELEVWFALNLAIPLSSTTSAHLPCATGSFASRSAGSATRKKVEAPTFSWTRRAAAAD